jgi:hypothetical protein
MVSISNTPSSFYLPPFTHTHHERMVLIPLTTDHTAHIHLFDPRPARFASSFSDANFSTCFRFLSLRLTVTHFFHPTALCNSSSLLLFAPSYHNRAHPMLCMSFASLAWCLSLRCPTVCSVLVCLRYRDARARIRPCYAVPFAQHNHTTCFLVHNAPAIRSVKPCHLPSSLPHQFGWIWFNSPLYHLDVKYIHSCGLFLCLHVKPAALIYISSSLRANDEYASSLEMETLAT